MKTAIQELIGKLSDTQRQIIGNSEYANGYDGALSDCINIAELLLEKEKQQIIDAYKCSSWMTQLAEQYYNETFKND